MPLSEFNPNIGHVRYTVADVKKVKDQGEMDRIIDSLYPSYIARAKIGIDDMTLENQKKFILKDMSASPAVRASPAVASAIAKKAAAVITPRPLGGGAAVATPKAAASKKKEDTATIQERMKMKYAARNGKVWKLSDKEKAAFEEMTSQELKDWVNSLFVNDKKNMPDRRSSKKMLDGIMVKFGVIAPAVEEVDEEVDVDENGDNADESGDADEIIQEIGDRIRSKLPSSLVNKIIALNAKEKRKVVKHLIGETPDLRSNAKMNEWIREQFE